MDKFIDYLRKQAEIADGAIKRLEAEERKDEADFAKVRKNIYEVCSTVTIAIANRPGSRPDAVKAQFERFRKQWTEAMEKAKEHGDARNTVIGETKLAALEDVIAHFTEAES